MIYFLTFGSYAPDCRKKTNIFTSALSSNQTDLLPNNSLGAPLSFWLVGSSQFWLMEYVDMISSQSPIGELDSAFPQFQIPLDGGPLYLAYTVDIGCPSYVSSSWQPPIRPSIFRQQALHPKPFCWISLISQVWSVPFQSCLKMSTL